jgi:Tfp pilus assembly protein PilX
MLNRRLAGERGSALVPALIVMGLLLTFAISTASLVESDQVSSRQERERESSFQLSEGVLNAQIYQLSTRWPSKTSVPYPPACSATAAPANCPTPTMLAQNYEHVDYQSGTTTAARRRTTGATTC